jgi:Protein of unknown function (DUF3638)/Protein of unknown function (DUF3645)
LRESQNVHAFSANDHPRWCVLEVEGGLQIRTEQATVAFHLIDNPGSVAQLNMGLGKTRVILPMLALHFAGKGRVPRLHFLSQLLGEGRENLALTLTASSFQLRLYELPFHRNRDLSEADYTLVSQTLRECFDNGGCLVVAPDHRVSLQLKRYELSSESHVRLLSDLGSEFIVDIFDEVDEAQHFRWHLVYAIGKPAALPAGRTRWICAEIVLDLLLDPPVGTELARLLADNEILERTETEMEGFSGRVIGIRFLAGPALESAKPLLSSLLAEELFSSVVGGARAVAEGLIWISNYVRDLDSASTTMFRAQFVAAVSDPFSEVNFDSALSEGQMETVFALRGFLAHSVVFSCLKKRPLVDFGLRDLSSLSRTRLAVPYRSCDTPAPRAEFSHPDLAIVLTLSTYYCVGLSAGQLRNAVQQLLRCGRSEQQREYATWIEYTDGPPDDAIDSVEKLDLTSEHQFALLRRTFGFNRPAINFFLNRVVFPHDTRQFSKELTSSAWDLATPTTIGFTGTNELARLLPISTRSEATGADALDATDGMMLDLLVRHSLDVDVFCLGDVSQPEANQSRTWQRVLAHAIDVRAGALIDVSGLLAGASNREAARYLVSELHEHACTFFDQDEGKWFTMTEEETVPLNRSPLPTHDTFALFDQTHCRGSDLHLKPDCVGLITLGPGLRKDQLAQGAGRLRQLHAGQRLRYASLIDVFNELSALSAGANTVGAEVVVSWALANSTTANESGLTRWATSGVDWISDTRENVLDHSVRNMYATCSAVKTALDIGNTRMQANLKTRASAVPRDRELQLAPFRARLEKYGSEHRVLVGAQQSVDRECERESEREQEEEAEEEKVRTSVAPSLAQEWDFQAARGEDLNSWPAGLLVPLRTSFNDMLTSSRDEGTHEPIDSPEWEKVQAFTTKNFRRTVPQEVDDAHEYLRPVENLYCYPSSGGVVVLSEYDANALLKIMQDEEAGAAAKPVLKTLAYINSFHKDLNINLSTVCALKLFAGIANFDASDREVVTSLLGSNTGGKARKTALRLADVRDEASRFPRSDLDNWTRSFV